MNVVAALQNRRRVPPCAAIGPSDCKQREKPLHRRVLGAVHVDTTLLVVHIDVERQLPRNVSRE
jgi:hypothetical protein